MEFITKILAHNEDGTSEIEMAVPSNSRGAINIICGPNNVGKTFLLGRIKLYIDMDTPLTAKGSSEFRRFDAKHYIETKKMRGYEIRSNVGSRIPTLFPEMYYIREMFGILDPSWETRALAINIFEHRTAIHGAMAIFFNAWRALQIGDANMQKRPITVEQFVDKLAESDGFKSEVVKGITNSGPFYPEDPSPFPLLERFLKSPIGVMPFDGGTAILCFTTNGEDVAFDFWSRGLQQLACLESTLAAKEYSVALIDEIETNFHPELISFVLEAFAKAGVQCIATTHHPHVMLSRFVDKLFHVERTPGKFDRKRWNIRFDELSSNFSKISNSYKLFTYTDSALLKQAAHIKEDADIRFWQEFIQSLQYDVVPVGKSLLPDSQSENLNQFLNKTDNALTVLDVGAGLGRTYLELIKVDPRFSRFESSVWYMWEPSESTRAKLSTILSNHANVHLPSTEEEIPQGAFDFVVLMNVLHELSSISLARVIELAHRSLKPTGQIVVGEIFPLLHAERFAVPYSDSDLRSMLTNCGYVCFSKNILFGTGAGYFVSAKKTDASLDAAPKIRQIIRRQWRIIKRDLVRQFAAMGPVPTDFSGYRNRLQALNTIASIDADQEGLWH